MREIESFKLLLVQYLRADLDISCSEFARQPGASIDQIGAMLVLNARLLLRLQALAPIIRSAVKMGNGDNDNFFPIHGIDQAIWKTPQAAAAGVFG